MSIIPFRILAAGAMAAAMLSAASLASEPSPYAGWQGRDIKALSPARAEDLRAGRGAGYALAAELNGYPGPRHVLDLADRLALSPAQRATVEAEFRAMQDEARRLGATLIERERAIDQLFAEGRASREAVEAVVAAAAETEARLRATHLRYHLTMRAVLTPVQVAEYNRLRGYNGAGHDGAGLHGGGHAH